MRIRRIFSATSLVIALATLTACGWSVTVKKTIDKPTEIDGTISGTFPELMRAMGAHAQTLSPIDLYIETAGTDFPLSTAGSAPVTLKDSSGTIVAAQGFPWIRVGTKLEFQNPAAVQTWANQYPSAAGVSYTLTTGNQPVDGQPHTMATAVVYTGAVQASARAVLPAQCYSRIHTVSLCKSDL